MVAGGAASPVEAFAWSGESRIPPVAGFRRSTPERENLTRPQPARPLFELACPDTRARLRLAAIPAHPPPRTRAI